MLNLAERMKPHLDGLSIRMLTSTAPRAVDSTDVLVVELKISDIDRQEVLWSDNEHRQDNHAALDLIKSESVGVDVLIVVTHLEYAEELPALFCEEVLGVRIERFRFAKGQGLIVSCEEKTAEVIS